MNIYLAIITTVLVLTQVIRFTQNAILLHRQKKAIAKELARLKDNDISDRGFDVLLRDYLERGMNIDHGACDENENDAEA